MTLFLVAFLFLALNDQRSNEANEASCRSTCEGGAAPTLWPREDRLVTVENWSTLSPTTPRERRELDDREMFLEEVNGKRSERVRKNVSR